MARVLCECGQSFTPFLINGVPRTQCPYCRRALSLGENGVIHAAVNLPIRQEPEPPPPQQTVPLSLAPSRELISTEPHRLKSVTITGEALRRLAVFLTRYVPRKTCQNCQPANCSQAFSCGALPSEGSGISLIAKFTFGGVAVAIVLVAVILSALSAWQRISPQLHVPRVAYVAVISLPVAIGGFVLLVSWRESNRRQQHVRDLAEATEKMGLQFVPLVTAPASLADDAFPVVCPTPPSGWSAAAEKPQATIFGTGIIHGHPLHLARFEFQFDPTDHMPLGGAIQAVQTLAMPRLRRQPAQIRQMYLIAIFPEPLVNTSDFLVTPQDGGFAATYIDREFGNRYVALPDYEGLGNYTLVSPSRENARSLPGIKVLNLLATEEGWAIQLVAGRLMIWRGAQFPASNFWSSVDPDSIVNLVHFAMKVRQVLCEREVPPT